MRIVLDYCGKYYRQFLLFFANLIYNIKSALHETVEAEGSIANGYLRPRTGRQSSRLREQLPGITYQQALMGLRGLATVLRLNPASGRSQVGPQHIDHYERS